MAAKREARTLDLIHRADTMVRLRLEEAFRPFDLTPGQHAVLGSLWGSTGLSASQLARRASVRPQSINEMVIALALKGLVEREEDPENRRVLKIRLSARGRKALRGCDAARDRLEGELLAGLRDDGGTELHRLLEALIAGPTEAEAARTEQPDLFAAPAGRKGKKLAASR